MCALPTSACTHCNKQASHGTKTLIIIIIHVSWSLTHTHFLFFGFYGDQREEEEKNIET